MMPMIPDLFDLHWSHPEGEWYFTVAPDISTAHILGHFCSVSFLLSILASDRHPHQDKVIDTPATMDVRENRVLI